MDLGVSGLASGFDWRTLVDQLVEVERVPERRLQAEQSEINKRNNAFASLKGQLTALANRLEKLKDAGFFSTRLAQSSATGIATATASTATPLGQYVFDIQHLASASVLSGAGNASASIAASNDVSAVIVNQASFGTQIKEGTFTVNGHQITFAGDESLQSVFDKINTATSGAVTATYDSATDSVTLSSSAEIVLGSATDTSNLLQALRFSNNGTGTITSSSGVGSLRLQGALASANFAVPLTDGGAGQGEFKINGVSITFNTANDTLTNVLERINSSAAGVAATYDSRNDRLVLTNTVTGDMGLSLEDVTGNFLAASGLSAGQLQRGADLAYTVNSGEVLTSHGNTITGESSGIPGLAVTALATGTASITVSTDSVTFKTAIKDFIEEYNKVQKLIDTQTASSTDSSGKVTAGVLAGDGDASEIASELRSLAFSIRSALTGSLKSLADLGFQSNGNDNTLALEDEAKLDAALATSLQDVRALFTDEVNGIASSLDNFLESTVGDDGTLVDKQALLTKQSTSIDTQISDMERLIADRRQQLIDSFLAMEAAQSRINQQLSFLQQRFGASSSTTK